MGEKVQLVPKALRIEPLLRGIQGNFIASARRVPARGYSQSPLRPILREHPDYG